MPYALVDVELTEPLPEIRLRPDESGVALVSRRDGRVVGFAMHDAEPGAWIDPGTVARLVDPAPAEPVPRNPSFGRTPRITVAICTRNRTELLRDCLSRLLELDPGPDEILVVDNAPSDGSTRDEVSGLAVRYEVEPCPGLDVARNRALRCAQGEAVAFLDDDVIPDAHWLEGVRAAWRQHPDAAGHRRSSDLRAARWVPGWQLPGPVLR
jgi:hypothetical protein